jgi:hypothetical protein
VLEPDALLARLDAIMAELAALRAAVAGANTLHNVDGIDTPADNLIDTTSAAARFGYSRDSIIRWCRQGCGRKVGGRWLADPHKLWAHINGG